jgi:hypothetical protein
LASEALEQGMAGVGELLEAQLEALGAGSAELSVEDFVDLEGGGPRLHPLMEGWVGECDVSWVLWAA